MRTSRPLPAGGSRSIIVAILGVLLLHLVLLFPGHPEKLHLEAWTRFPLELPVLLLLLLSTPPRPARWLYALLVLSLGLLLLLRLADLGSYLAFNRRFSPLLELHLVADGWNLASTSIGPVEAGIVVVLTLLVLAAFAVLLYRSLRTIAQVTGNARKLALWLGSTSLIIGVIVLMTQNQQGQDTLVEARVIPEFAQRISSLRKSISDQREFIDALGSDDVLDHTVPGFQALADRDVILIFVESYGRGYLDAERFADDAKRRLRSVEGTLHDAGLSAKSGWLTSPIRGGRSWLAHATLQSGLEVGNQARFDRLVTSDRVSLSGLFRQAGWRSLGIMPGIQLAWPEGVWYGFDDLYTSTGMDYAGERFGYVTMPDQYTLSHFDNVIRQSVDKPIMASIALLSTHAPWTPLPRRLDWDSIEDGSVYDGSHRFGERISWKYRDKVQDMYARSFDYTLGILGEYAARFADDALIVLVGDHQPPPVINGWGNSGDVPVHFISRDRGLLERLPDTHWDDGMIPGSALTSQPMSTLRRQLSTLFE
ncbi:MAG: sulfatase [Granulosicoccus sp.]|nr:sulfatase [Granulosicoccus sp.]